MQWIHFARRALVTVATGATVLTALWLPGAARAQVGGTYDLRWSTIDGGGGTSTAAHYRLFGTAGQPDAGRLLGGRYDLRGGFGSGGTAGTIAVPDPGSPAAPPISFGLRSIAPNPFTHQTTITFDLPVAAPVELDVYSAAGKLVHRLLAESRPAGRHAVVWNRDRGDIRLARGVYILRLHAAGETATRKIVLYH